MHYNGWLNPIECIQDNALIISVFVPSELATYSMTHVVGERTGAMNCHFRHEQRVSVRVRELTVHWLRDHVSHQECSDDSDIIICQEQNGRNTSTELWSEDVFA
jgi:hypothetical protein